MRQWEALLSLRANLQFGGPCCQSLCVSLGLSGSPKPFPLRSLSSHSSFIPTLPRGNSSPVLQLFRESDQKARFRSKSRNLARKHKRDGFHKGLVFRASEGRVPRASSYFQQEGLSWVEDPSGSGSMVTQVYFHHGHSKNGSSCAQGRVLCCFRVLLTHQ